ncbi:50S ribosomal protein L22 [Patescibacteria group bacterium]|nr:50S ribosomal protein L22 [Patescibacteria group bacterium]MBU1890336.1 50S ribosomal protein L22 [Patescibacteria group bacterium]
MEIKAQLKHIRISARKIRLAVGFLKGYDVTEALHQLEFSKKGCAPPVIKLLKSAIANASNNHEIEKNNLYIKEILVDEGTTLKRFQPRAFGRAGTIRKRSAHITVVLTEKKVSKKKSAKKKEEAKDTVVPKEIADYKDIVKEAVTKNKAGFQEIKKDEKPIGKFQSIKDKFIRRTGKK